MSKFCPNCSGLVPNPNMTVCPNCGADLSNVTEDVLDVNVPVNNSSINNIVNNGYVNNSPMNNNIVTQEPVVDNQPKLDPNLNFANSTIFKESAPSASNNPNNNVVQNNQSSLNGTFFNQNVNNNFNNGNQFIGNANSMPNGNYNQVNNQLNNINQNMMNNQINNQLNNINQNVMNSQGNVIKPSIGKKRVNLKTIIMSCSVVLVLVIAIVAFLIISSGPKAVAQKYYDGLKSFNVKKVVSTYPKSMRADMKENLEEMLPEMKDYYDEMDIKTKKVTISSDYEKVKKSDVSYLLEELDDEYDIKKSSIDEIRKYDVTTITVVDGEEKETESSIMVFKIGLKWYILT